MTATTHAAKKQKTAHSKPPFIRFPEATLGIHRLLSIVRQEYPHATKDNITDYLKCLALLYADKQGEFALPVDYDGMWQEALLDNKYYKDVCRFAVAKFGGEQYVHGDDDMVVVNDPMVENNDKELLKRKIKAFRAAFRCAYGESIKPVPTENVSCSDSVCVNIKRSNVDMVTLKVGLHMSVEQVKDLIAKDAQLGVAVNKQKLMYHKAEMDDEKPLKSYDVTSESTLRLAVL